MADEISWDMEALLEMITTVHVIGSSAISGTELDAINGFSAVADYLIIPRQSG